MSRKFITVMVLAMMVFSFSFATVLLMPVSKENTELDPEPELEKIEIIITSEEYAKKPTDKPGGKPVKCYDFIGAKWKTLPVNLVVNPTNPDELSEEFITGAVDAGAEEWDSHSAADIYGSYSIDTSATYDDTVSELDGRNEVVFGPDEGAGTIAVTIIWGYFSGPPKNREIIEFDIKFNTYYPWGDASLNENLMDFQGIFTHELGHGFGLADVYDSGCLDATMYGYGDYGDTHARDLDTPDQTGIQELYD